MDPWSYSPDGRDVFFANEFDLSTDSFARNRKFTPEWDQKPSNFMENGVFMSEFADRGSSDMVTKPFHGKSNEFSADSTRNLAASCPFASNLSSEETESSSKLPSLPSQELSGIDLRLRKHMDYMNSPNDVFKNDTRVIASAPAKKSRAANLCSQKPSCQVYGCNMDLSSSKDYHRRHRVCETHSKTPMVIVNGIEQRFCQQCSRFHLLKEFDDRKRSCRRRLAGHNERRRKPSFYLIPGRGHRVLRPSQVAGNKFLGTSLAKDFSLVLPEAYPASLLYRVRDEQNCHASRLVKFEDDYSSCPQTSIYPANAQNSSRNHRSDLLPKKNRHSDPTISLSEATDVSSSHWELHEVSRSSCALSLLSVQSQHVSGTPSATFWIAQANENKGPRKELAIGVHSPRATPRHSDQMESLLINCGKDGPFFPGSGSGSSLSHGKGSSTVDLLQLSSHLQRVEQQRNSSQVKKECNELHYRLGSQVSSRNQRFGN